MALQVPLLKKCWPIIKSNFIQLCHDFHGGKVSLQNIHGSLITLVPKKLSPERVNDFRSISLTNTYLICHQINSKQVPSTDH